MRLSNKIKDREMFTPTENEIARFIMANSSEAVDMSLQELAEKIYVSKSTIIRFCKKLGFRGHKEMCVELAKELNRFAEDDTSMDPSIPLRADDDARKISGKITALHYRAAAETHADLDLEKLSSIAKHLRESKEIYVYALEECALLGLDFVNKLKQLGYHIHMPVFAGSERTSAAAQPADSCALFVTYTGRETMLRQCARMLAEKKIPVYLITGPFRDPIRRYANTAIEISYYESIPKIAAFGSETAVRLVLDTLYGLIFQLDYDKNIALIQSFYDTRTAMSDNDE